MLSLLEICWGFSMKAGLLNNTNAQKGCSKKTEILNVRVTFEDKERWKAKADSEGIALACLVERALNFYCYSTATQIGKH